jgi:methyl-accepting chemotaxis protein
MSSTIRRTSAIAFGVVAVVLAVVSTFGYGTVRRSAEANLSVAHTYQVLNALDQVLITMADAETGARGFVATGVGRYLEAFTQADASLAPQIDTLTTLTADSPVQQRYISELRTNATATMRLLRQMISRGQAHEPTRLDLENPEKANMDVVRADLRQMRAERAAVDGATQQRCNNCRRSDAGARRRTDSRRIRRARCVVFVGGPARGSTAGSQSVVGEPGA